MAQRQILLTTTEICYAFGVSKNTFSKWNLEVAETRKNTNYYDLKSVIAWRIEQAETKHTVEKKTKAEEELRWTTARADKAQLAVEVQRRRLLPAKLVQDVWADQISRARAKLLSLPKKLAPQMTSDRTENQILLKDVIYEALEELKDYEPRDYTGDDEYDEGGDLGSGNAVGTTTGPNRKRVGRSRKTAKSRVKR